MARKKNDLEWTDRELVHLLNEMNQSDEEAIVPLSDDEVASIEDAYPEVAFSAERDKRQRAHLEELRERWVADTEKIESLVHYAEERGLPPDELAHRLRLGLDIIFKLQLRLLRDIPHSQE